MSKSNLLENSLLLLLFNNVAFEGIGDAGGLDASLSAGNLYISLHTADPGEAGDQTTNEANYTGYVRIPVARTSSGWTITGNVVKNVAAIDFPINTGSTQIITHLGVGTVLSGTGKLLYSDVIRDQSNNPISLSVSSGVSPTFPVEALSISED